MTNMCNHKYEDDSGDWTYYPDTLDGDMSRLHAAAHTLKSYIAAYAEEYILSPLSRILAKYYE